jgi:acyl-coenzyme A synthetase/AMP-(fatty) acid ligase
MVRPLHSSSQHHNLTLSRIGGFTYADVLNIYGISRAGYIPQLFSLRLPNPTVVRELLEKTGAQALIYDTSYTDAVSTILLPKFLPCSDLNVSVSDITLPSLEVVDSSRIAFIFHTSGSTSGSPKLVPCTYQWVEAAIHKTSIAHAPYNADVQDVAVYMGSMCHIGQACSEYSLFNLC